MIDTAPKPPGSRQLISPPAAVFEMAPAKVLHGAVRLQGFTSSPTPDTHVRVACACAGTTPAAPSAIATAALRTSLRGRTRTQRSIGLMAYISDTPRRVTGAAAGLAQAPARLGSRGMHARFRARRG